MLTILVLLTVSPLFIGIINRVKSVCAGRQGPGLLQPYFDYLRLFRKSQVVSPATSFIFQLAPTISWTTVFFAGLLIPFGPRPAVISFPGDFILLAYVLAFGRFFALLSAMDTGSSFEGMGASREVTFATLVEPAFFILFSTITFLSGFRSLSDVFAALHQNDSWTLIVISLSVLILFLMMLVEGSRLPIDDPNTHLELTMIHEVMVLDNSGPDLGLILYGTAMKLAAIGLLIANLLVPPGFDMPFLMVLFLGILFVLAVAIGILESSMARLRMVHVPQFVLVMTSIGLLILSFVFFSIGGHR